MNNLDNIVKQFLTDEKKKIDLLHSENMVVKSGLTSLEEYKTLLKEDKKNKQKLSEEEYVEYNHKNNFYHKADPIRNWTPYPDRI